MQYNYIKKAEHFWKGMGGHESQISPIPPVRYGDRFVKFISGITMSREAAEKERVSAASDANAVILPSGRETIFNDPNLGGVNVFHEKPSNPAGTQAVMEEASHIALKTMQHGASEEDVPDRQISTVRSPGGTETDISQLLPVIGEAGESASNASRTPSRITPSHSREDMTDRQRLVLLGNANMPAEAVGEVPPPTPPKMDGSIDTRAAHERLSWGGRPPPTPPKDDSRNSDDERRSRGPSLDKALPLPPATHQLSASPTRIGDDGWGGLTTSAAR
jgi:1-phosphatidylinositol-4-phosphate 5-kinase